jgi:hypothetical protein
MAFPSQSAAPVQRHAAEVQAMAAREHTGVQCDVLDRLSPPSSPVGPPAALPFTSTPAARRIVVSGTQSPEPSPDSADFVPATLLGLPHSVAFAAAHMARADSGASTPEHLLAPAHFSHAHAAAANPAPPQQHTAGTGARAAAAKGEPTMPVHTGVPLTAIVPPEVAASLGLGKQRAPSFLSMVDIDFDSLRS